MPAVLLLDVNETLSDMAPLGERFAEVGAAPELAGAWFASVLRDGFALAVAGEQAPFSTIAAELLRTRLAPLPLTSTLDEAVETVMGAFTSLEVHPDVPDGLRRIAASGVRVVTLSNGAASVAAGLLERAGLDGVVERTLSVEDAGVWKPGPASYAYALAECGVRASDAVLAAVHPWDVDGARRAGLVGAWVDRAGSAYPSYFAAPDLTASGFTDLADQLGAP